MKILVLLTPAAGKLPADFAAHVVAEEVALWPLYKQGLVREMYFQPEPITVSLVFEAPSLKEVEAALKGLPMVRENLFDVRLVKLGPWANLEVLFDRVKLQSSAL
jgi:muconolactone delta-isomerase